jgi:hypothetical protein
MIFNKLEPSNFKLRTENIFYLILLICNLKNGWISRYGLSHKLTQLADHYIIYTSEWNSKLLDKTHTYIYIYMLFLSRKYRRVFLEHFLRILNNKYLILL